MLEKLLDDNDYVCVYFCKYLGTSLPPLYYLLGFPNIYSSNVFTRSNSVDEDDCQKCDDILDNLESIDTETDNLDILFVKIKDTKYAKKWGVGKVSEMGKACFFGMQTIKGHKGHV